MTSTTAPSVTTLDLDRLVPTPLGFIETGMTVVSADRVAHAAAGLANRKRPRHHAIEAWLITSWQHHHIRLDGDEYHLWHFELTGQAGQLLDGYASGSPADVFAGYVLRDGH